MWTSSMEPDHPLHEDCGQARHDGRRVRARLHAPPMSTTRDYSDRSAGETDCEASDDSDDDGSKEVTADSLAQSVLNRKLHCLWREDMLASDKRALLQDKTDNLIGKQDRGLFLPPLPVDTITKPMGRDPFHATATPSGIAFGMDTASMDSDLALPFRVGTRCTDVADPTSTCDVVPLPREWTHRARVADFASASDDALPPTERTRRAGVADCMSASDAALTPSRGRTRRAQVAHVPISSDAALTLSQGRTRRAPVANGSLASNVALTPPRGRTRCAREAPAPVPLARGASLSSPGGCTRRIRWADPIASIVLDRDHCGTPDPWGTSAPSCQSLRTILQSIQDWQAPPTQKPMFAFRWTTLAAKTNLEILESFGMDLGAALRAQPFSALTLGSEFRSPTVLEPLCRFHPLWPRVKRWLTDGVSQPLEPITEEDRLADLTAALHRGNHQSANQQHNRLIAMLCDEVHRGWQLILPRHSVSRLPNAVIAPLGMTLQDSINDKGEIIQKWRLTHDQSFNALPGVHRSVNDRLRPEDLTPCCYGHALLCHIHFIVGLRLRFPYRRILQTKADLKSAYRRLHYDAKAALQAVVSVDDFLLVALRLTFGGSANPSQWSDVSEMLCDLANDLVSAEAWDPAVFQSPHHDLLGGAILFEPADVPLATTSPLAVTLPDENAPKTDCYIDDLFTAFLETDVDRGRAIVPFLIYLLARPLHPNESLSRDDVLSLSKFRAEATPAECKIVLGWLVDSRRLLISMPDDKFVAWTQSIESLLTDERVTHKALEKLIGRLNHAGFIIPLARHFLGRLRSAMYAADHRRTVRLTVDQCSDLRLWKRFLCFAREGISLNLLTFRLPTRILRNDAALHGIGGFSATSGVAWRWEIPAAFRLRATLNALEFLAAYVNLFMDIHFGGAPADSCFLSQGDSTSAAGWLRKSNFDDADPLHLTLARETATLIMEHTSCLYSQWFPGAENEVADSLSHSRGFYHMSSSARTRLANYDLAAQLAGLDGVTGGTTAKQARYWCYWETFLQDIELDGDPYLSGFSRGEQHRIIGAFAAAVRANHVQTYPGAQSAPPPVSGTVRATLDAVAQAFRTVNLPSPVHDSDGKLAFILQRQLRGYTNTDPGETPQKALTPKILRFIYESRLTSIDEACGQLAGGAFFFAMRSCEYTKTSGERRTKLLCLKNLRFFRDNKEIPHDHPTLRNADCIAITFEFQKNDERDATVTMHRTRDPVLCPVRMWADITQRILSYDGTGPESPVNMVVDATGKLVQVTSKMLLTRIRAAVKVLGETELGYSAGEVGTHSIRSAAAMAMYLAGVPVFTIMLIGRWSSDAFLWYIRRQVQEFSAGVSSRMLLSRDFFTIPDVAHHEDPRSRGNPHNFAARSNHGPGTQRWASTAAFALHY